MEEEQQLDLLCHTTLNDGTEPMEDMPMGKNTKILVADDDSNMLLLMNEILRTAGYEVLEASTGRECLDVLRAHRPDLVLLDVVLPDMTGMDVCRQIKTDLQLGRTFVILVSGVHVSSDHQADGLNVGADGYIVKPIPNKELLARVQAMERIKRAEDARQASELRYRRLFETAQDGILIADADTGQIEDVNPSLLKMLDYTREEFLGRELWEIGLFNGTKAAALTELRSKGVLRDKDLSLVTKRGEEIAVECVSNVSDVDERNIIQCNIRDVTERKRLEEKLESMSLIDDLTGLYNRRGFFALAQQQVRIAERREQKILLFYVDLDNLKQINDAGGHQEGDNALVEVAAVLKETFRKSDIIGRVGGDEFAVLAPDTARETADVLMNRLRGALQDRSRLGTGKYALSVSAGIASNDPDNPASLDELIRRADALMYEQKRTKQR